MTMPESEKKCWCGHPRRWHQEGKKVSPIDFTTVSKGEWSHCLEWGCSCKQFTEALP